MLLGNSNGEQLESGVGGLNVSDGSGGEGGVQLKKGPWTAAEDAILTEYVRKHGEGNWNAVQRNTGLARCGKSCRLRWANHLRPNLKKGTFSPEEERLIVELHAQLGNKWARMAAQLPGRTDNEIKNYWNTRVKRRHRQGLPLYPPEIQPQHQHQHQHQNHQQSSHSHHSYHSQPSTPTTPTSSFSFPIAATTPTTPTGGHHQHHSLHHHFPPPCYSRSPTPSSLPPTPPPLSPGLRSPHQPAFPTLTLFDTNTNTNANNNSNAANSSVMSSNNISNTFNMPRTPPLLQNPPRFKRFHSDTSINTFAANQNDINNNNNINSSSSFQGSNNFSMPFLPFFRSPSSPSLLTSPTSNCNTSAFPSATTKLLSHPSFSFGNQNSSAIYRNPDEKECILTSTGSVFNLKPELPSSQSLSQNVNAEILRSKPKEETGGQINMHEDISKLLNVIPSMQVPEWYNDSGEASNCQSSVVTDDNLGLELQQLASILHVDSTTAPGSCSYDNLPGIC
ncbi:hypothetical protein CISIN_1g046419mg [Citrus sinensis]|uniref:Uncharacterized protein n=1 Tax=Citrus sinensis TaxID=2711 RepID=A0A067F9F7_CITSI|nr:hypothetical protein CISIN_1g046419mg [Citrus sinensis]